MEGFVVGLLVSEGRVGRVPVGRGLEDCVMEPDADGITTSEAEAEYDAEAEIGTDVGSSIADEPPEIAEEGEPDGSCGSTGAVTIGASRPSQDRGIDCGLDEKTSLGYIDH